MPPTLDPITKKPLHKYAVLDNEGIVFAGAKLRPKQVHFSNFLPNSCFIFRYDYLKHFRY